MSRVLVATGETVLARGFEAILTAAGLEVADVCNDVAGLFDAFHRRPPDIAILDMPVLPEMGIIGELLRLAPRCQIVLWSRQISPEQANEAFRWGARGVLPASVSPAGLVESLDLLATFPRPAATPSAQLDSLCSPAERQLLELLGRGMNNQEIAAVMRYDERTVDRVLKNVARQLGAQGRCELALYGLSATSEEPTIIGETEQWKKEIAIV